MPTLTQQKPTIMTKADIPNECAAFHSSIQADGAPFNGLYLWRRAIQLQEIAPDIRGDAFVIALALASMERIPGQGCRASHKQIAQRASAIKRLFALADAVGWDAMIEHLGIEGA